MTNVPQLLGKDLGEDGLKYVRSAGAAALDDLPEGERETVEDLFAHMHGLNAAVMAATDDTQNLTTTQASGILGMLPTRYALAYAELTMRKADNTSKPVTAGALREFASASEPEPKKPFRGMYGGVADGPVAGVPDAPAEAVEAVHPPVEHKVCMGCGPVEYLVSTVMLRDFQDAANRVGLVGWRLAGQSLTKVGDSHSAVTATYMRSLKSGTSRRDDDDQPGIEAPRDAALDQRSADDGPAGTQSSGRGGRDGRISLPVVR